jgi:hypothetical protein
MSGRSVLLWVVLPFLVLCALALWLTRPAPPPTEAVAPPRPRDAPNAPNVPSLVTPPMPGRDSPPVAPPPGFPSQRGTPPLVGSGVPPALERAAEEEAWVASITTDPVAREDVRAAVRAVRPLLDRCFEDVADRHPGEQRATLRFTLEGGEEAGRLSKGQVMDTSVQDPMLRACLEDSLLDAQVPPLRRGEPLPLTYPYRFRPPARPGGPASRPERPTPEGGDEAPLAPSPTGR